MRLLRRILQRLGCEGGSATVEFVIAFPVVITVVLSGMESGLFLSRKVMLDRAVDLTVRELRLAQINRPTHQIVKEHICARTSFLPDCLNVLRLELIPVAMSGAWALPTAAPACVNRVTPINPPEELNAGGENELVLLRVCAVVDVVFPNIGLGLYLPKDASGGVRLISTSAFVNEPRPSDS